MSTYKYINSTKPFRVKLYETNHIYIFIKILNLQASEIKVKFHFLYLKEN